MNSVDEYIKRQGPSQAEIAQKLRTLILSNFPQLKEEYKWNMPVYTLNGKDVTYLKTTKEGVNLGLNAGAHISDPKSLMEGTGKEMRHIKVSSPEVIDESYFVALLNQAVKL
jgi:hypothetical protein